MKTLTRKFSLSTLSCVIVFISNISFVYADDIEIYNRTTNIPNLLFIIDTSGSMGDPVDSSNSSSPSRLSAVQTAFQNILSQPYSLLNVGVMNFSGDTGSGVDLPVADVNQLANNVESGVVSTTETYAQLLTRNVNALSDGGNTPTVQALYEAALYFRGDDVHSGATGTLHTGWDDNVSVSMYTGGDSTSAGLRTYITGTSGPEYISPIQTACTENFIVLLSDGKPTREDSTIQANIRTLTGKTSCDDLGSLGIADTEIIDKGECGIDLLSYLNTVDQSSSSVGTNQPGDQFITTHTIGFQIDGDGKKYLEELANAGGGIFYDASDPSSLVTTLQNIVTAITQKSRTITAIGNTLDLSTLGSSRDEIYVPMFVANPNRPRWQGNFKGYLLDPGGFLTGLDGNPVFTSTGDFEPSARSFWTSTADGGDINEGGVAALLNPSTRNVMTDDGAGNLISFDAANSSLTGNPSLFGLPGTTTTSELQDLINWARGVDINDEDLDGSTSDARNFVGDPLHTNPVVANYTGGSIERVAFFMTNEGYLHAIDVTGNTSTTGGNELFSFMPRELLDNLDPLRKNVGGTAKIYGLDGPLVLFQVGGAANAAGNKYLYFGMRRGGLNYYAVDVTNPSSPSLMWKIEGGIGDFQEMGQSWSEPIVTNVTHGGSTKLALVFGGGYDTTQDSAVTHTVDSRGRAIYVVDAVTGTKLWSAGPSGSPDTHDLTLGLTNGIAGDVSVIDLNSDTIADRLYFGTTGGSIWRVDFQGDLNGSAGFSNDFSGYELARFHGSAINDNRRFFARPVAALTSNGKLAVTVGSGHRSHPLDTAVQDRLYTIYDPNINSVPTSAPVVITDSDLQDLTGFTSGFDSSGSLVSGWRVDLDIAGEKVFNAASVLRGEVFISTYYPPTTMCSNDPDGSRLFVVDLEGNPTRNLDGDINGIKDPYVTILNFGIVPELTLHYGSTGMVRGVFLPNIGDIYTSGTLEDRFWTNNP